MFERRHIVSWSGETTGLKMQPISGFAILLIDDPHSGQVQLAFLASTRNTGKPALCALYWMNWRSYAFEKAKVTERISLSSLFEHISN
jgi:hypothetical protein